jgi:hypothetical protein
MVCYLPILRELQKGNSWQKGISTIPERLKNPRAFTPGSVNKGQYHYVNGGRKEELIHPYARAGWEAEKFQRFQKQKQARGD